MPIKSKAFGAADLELKAVDDGADPVGSFHAVLSKATVDRDGEIIDSGAFEPLPARISIDVDHGLTFATVVGSGVPSYEADGTLTVKGTYSSRPFAQEVRALVREGHISTMSVAFMGGERTKAADGATPHVTKGELLNATFCAVPVNRDALVLAAKALSVKAGARNSKTDAEHLQAAHDSIVSAGAACSGYGKAVKALPMPATAGEIDDDPGMLAAGADATYDEVCAAYEAGDTATFEAQLAALGAVLDQLLETLGIPDADDATEGTSATTPKGVAPGSVQAGDKADQEDLELRARVLGLVAAF